MYTVDGGPVFRSAFVLNEEKGVGGVAGIVKKKKRKELEPYCEQFFALFRATYLQPKEKYELYLLLSSFLIIHSLCK